MANVSVDFVCDEDVKLNFCHSRFSDSITQSMKNSISISPPNTGIQDPSFKRMSMVKMNSGKTNRTGLEPIGQEDDKELSVEDVKVVEVEEI
jgi:hypothetical protein